MIRALYLLALTALVIPAAAQETVVIYRCTDASGAVSVQNDVPCRKGSQQQRRVMETARTSPTISPPLVSTPVIALTRTTLAATDMDSDTAESRGGATSAIPELSGDSSDHVPATPPPELFSCRAWDRTEHFSDDPVPTRRCAPMRVSGLDGSAGGANASACQYVTDTCAPVPQEALCKQWQQHAHDTRAMLLFGRAEDPAATRVELQRIEAIIAASTCRGDG